MVSFLWGNSRKSFPDSKEAIKREMKDYILDINVDFIADYRNSMRTAQQEKVDTAELNEAFEEILKEILKEPLLDYIKAHDEGKKAINNFTTFKVSGERKENKPNIELLNDPELLLEKLFDSKILAKLRGQGQLQVKSGKTELEDFDYENMLADYVDNEYIREMNIELVFREVLPEEMDKYDPTEQRFSYGKDQFKFRLPISDNELISQKQEHINKETSLQPDFDPSRQKTSIDKLKFNLKINFPQDVIDKLEAPPSLEIQEVEPVTSKNNRIINYRRIGEPERINASEFNLMRIGKEKERTNLMQELRIFSLGDKLYQIVVGSVSGAGKTVRVPNSVITYLEDEFYKILKKIEKGILEPYLADPLEVYTYSAVGNFKTSSRLTNSLTRNVGKVQEGKHEKIDKIEVIIYDEETKSFKSKSLSVEKARELESEAWSLIEGKEGITDDEGNMPKKISNSEYLSLNDGQKASYSPNYYIVDITDGGQVNPLGEEVTTKRNIVGYKLKDAPEDAFALIPAKKGYLILKDAKLGTEYEKLERPDGKGEMRLNRPKDNILPSRIESKEEYEELLQTFVPKRGKGTRLITLEGIKRLLADDKKFKEKFKNPQGYIKANDLVPAASFYKQAYRLEYDNGKYVSQKELDKYKKEPIKLRAGEIKIDDKSLKAAKFPDSPFAFEPDVRTEKPYLLVNIKRKNWNGKNANLYTPIYEDREMTDSEKKHAKKVAERRFRSELKFKVEDPTKFGKETIMSMSVVTDPEGRGNSLIFFENVEKAFNPAILMVDIVLTKLGDFTLSSYRRRKNDEMLEVLEDLTENIETLKEKIGVD